MQIPESESVVSRPGLRSAMLFTRHFRWWIVLCLVVIAAMLVVWNKPHPAYAIRFKSSKGDVLATGSIQLNSRLPRSGQVTFRYQFKFNKVFKDQEDAKWLYSILGNAESGDAAWGVEPNQSGQRRNVINFMPGLEDADVSAMVDDLGEGKLAGTWQCDVFRSRGSNKGTVELIKTK